MKEYSYENVDVTFFSKPSIHFLILTILKLTWLYPSGLTFLISYSLQFWKRWSTICHIIWDITLVTLVVWNVLLIKRIQEKFMKIYMVHSLRKVSICNPRNLILKMFKVPNFGKTSRTSKLLMYFSNSNKKNGWSVSVTSIYSIGRVV